MKRHDTRRMRHKLIGGHNGHVWGWHQHIGSYYKNLLRRLHRRYDRKIEQLYALHGTNEVEIPQFPRRLLHIWSEVNWKLW